VSIYFDELMGDGAEQRLLNAPLSPQVPPSSAIKCFVWIVAIVLAALVCLIILYACSTSGRTMPPSGPTDLEASDEAGHVIKETK
jgi:hypothetical protein